MSRYRLFLYTDREVRRGCVQVQLFLYIDREARRGCETVYYCSFAESMSFSKITSITSGEKYWWINLHATAWNKHKEGVPEKVVGKSLVLEGPDAHPEEEDPAQQHQDVRDAHAPSVLGHNFSDK